MISDLSPSGLRAIVDGLHVPQLYCGVYVDGERLVTADDRILSAGPSQLIWNHSPDGFNWGYGGSGPAQLALGLLFDAGLPPDVCARLHQDLKWAKVAKWNQQACWTLPGAELLRWIRAALEELAAEDRELAEGRTDGS